MITTPIRKKDPSRAYGGRRSAPAGPSKIELQRLIRELEVQQEEIRRQNHQLTESQRLLEESRDRYASLYDFAPVAYLTLTKTGIISEINVTGATLLGQPRGRLVDRPFLHFVDPGSRRALLDHLRQCRLQSHTVTVELMLRSEDGRMIPIQLSSNPASIEQGSVVRIRSVVFELSDRKRAEEQRERLRATQASEQLLQTVLQNLPVGVRLLDRQGNILLSNEVCGMIWADPMLPMAHWDSMVARWVPSGLRVAQRDWPAARALSSGKGVINELIELVKGGAVTEASPTGHRFIQQSAVPVRDVAGEVLGVVIVTEDVTAQIRNESRLRDAKEAAEQAGRVKDEFLAVTSHELRTPISSVLLWIHLLKGSIDDPHARMEAIGMIEQSARAQASLINDLLDISRMLVGKMRLDLVPRDLGAILTASVDSVRPSAGAKGIEISIEDPLSPVMASVDMERMQQVFGNLLTNAIKFTPEKGRIDVRLTLKRSRARISVTDSGEGINAEFLPHVFDRFRQADSTITRRYGGLGLGLSISHQLIKMHGGSITAQSDGPGRGATFTVELPVTNSSAAPASRPHSMPDPDDAASIPIQEPSAALLDWQETMPPREPCSTAAALKAKPLRGVRVLLVEDEHSTRVALTRLLREAGATVTSTASASAAFEAFSRAIPSTRPHVVLSDVSMPDEDGYMLLGRLRAVESQWVQKKSPRPRMKSGSAESPGACEGAPMPAVALTANARPEDITRSRAAGFQAHLSKPVDPRRLIALLADLAAQSET